MLKLYAGKFNCTTQITRFITLAAQHTYESIISGIKSGKIAPVYYLFGEEDYYIDALCDYMENNILDEASRGFNQMVLYGKDVDVQTVVSNARRFPVMAPYQVIIIKEAQTLKGLDDFEPYFEKPVPSTILVICNKSSKLDKRTRFYKALTKHVIFESKKIYQNQVSAWVVGYLKNKGYTISPRAAELIAESIGNDLSKLVNELEKLIINKTDGKEITDTDVELKIGISREFNIFELINAIAAKNASRAFHIAHHLGRAKDFSIIAACNMLTTFFSKTYMVKSSNIKAPNEAQQKLGLNYYQAQDCTKAAKNYKLEEIERAIRLMHEYDLKAKGVNNLSAKDDQLLKELLVKLLH
jgi:DNA polymerase-3 subunit delta